MPLRFKSMKGHDWGICADCVHFMEMDSWSECKRGGDPFSKDTRCDLFEPMMLNYLEEDNPKMYQEVSEEFVIPIEMKETCPVESEIIKYIRAMEEEE